jgi:hypothetical protein
VCLRYSVSRVSQVLKTQVPDNSLYIVLHRQALQAHGSRNPRLLSLSLACPPSLSLLLSLSLGFFILSFLSRSSLSRSLSLTHTHSLPHSLSLSLARSLSRALSFSLSLIHSNKVGLPFMCYNSDYARRISSLRRAIS